MPEQARPAELEIRRVRDLGERPDYRKVRRALETARVHRISPGAYAPNSAWQALPPRERHRLKVVEATARMQHPAVISHFAAASVHGIEILGAWPSRIDVRVAAGRGGRSSGLIRRHGIGVVDVDALDWGVHRITTPAQTAIDIAAVADHELAVVVFDQVLWARRPGGALATMAELRMLAERRSSPKGAARIRRALEVATSLSDSVRESQSRVLLKRLGFPEPVLQHPFQLPDGSTARTDFFFPEQNHVGEFDGIGKYLDPELLQGRSPEAALIAEKDRADAISRLVGRVSRWRTPNLRRPRELYDILIADGLPSSLPPPPRSLRLPR
ncbi:hypothetical protein FM104_07315 [Microbacterium esteraromaticum]|uniref:Uncharacterized protein n=1 Tax=Microbacterium esteraromaticum TaxID=57043 RepID=A0A1R4JGQ9_9MICO|nr:hypothetical protein [Microbacterium esteraromaticum]SJN31189.1 hypothetical protein FM104_07315 [Microbacterium esteraromaticum]